MKILTLKNRLSKRYKGSKTSKAYQVIIDLVEGNNSTCMIWNGLIRPVKNAGSGRFHSYADYTRDITAMLDLLGIRYTTGNDAPRGGKSGNWIKILTKIQ